MNYKILIITFLAVFLTASVGSLFTNADTDWYESVKPEITPPNYVFPVVWTILYIMIAVSFYLSVIKSNNKQKKIIYYVFGINLLLNALWSILFFGLQNPIASFIEIIVLWISILTMLVATYKTNKISFYLLIPYFLWVSFASYLNYLIAF